MNSTQTTQAPTQSSAPKQKAVANQQSSGKSAYKQADQAAKRGEPLPAETPRERSPKQENL